MIAEARRGGRDGARAPVRSASSRPWLIGAAGLSALALYAMLKAAWAMGSRVGIEDVAAWDRAFGQLSDLQHWAALWGTDLLALAAAIVLVAVLADRSTPLGRSPARGVVRAASWTGGILFGLFALTALGSTILTDVAVSRGDADPAPMASWVYYGVYGSFLVYALALVAALRTTRHSRP